MPWFTIVEIRNAAATDQRVIYDGYGKTADAMALAHQEHKRTHNRIVITTGKRIGKFLTELTYALPR